MGLSDANISEAKFEGTGYSYTMSLIQGKHKMVILYCLIEFQPVRFNEMKRYLTRRRATASRRRGRSATT